MKKKLKDFEKRLKKIKNSNTKINQKKNNNFQNFGMFLKSGIELVSPVIVGVVIGLFCVFRLALPAHVPCSRSAMIQGPVPLPFPPA